MKRKSLNIDRINQLVKERVLGDGALLPEHKINKIIKDYLLERDYMDPEVTTDKYEFDIRTKKAFEDMSDGISEMIGDLEVIRTREGDVLIDEDMYSEEFLTDLITSFESIKEDLEFLSKLDKEGDSEDFSMDEEI